MIFRANDDDMKLNNDKKCKTKNEVGLKHSNIMKLE